ncbi:hypothetical protein [Microbacterium sp. SLBN-146]|uniref:hypothetical protein n=1 Tax=Microbacterium sp. SLBN-146 TaxID=2768457 RepID=UPI0011547D01|nr:hypothetical protein [Microbacterium sp. SLBN-146]TQJ32000.1 hypothetical protein FBY39_2493 [Microbacterium sp. SLBN-146]
MPERLLLADPHSAADALTFAGRAATMGDGAVRLRAAEGVLVMTSAPLAPRGLFDQTPTVLGMRVLRADPELECDLVVAASELARDQEAPHAVVLPESGLAPPWAGITPPRGGWAARPGIAAATLATRAQWGIAAVAEAIPRDAGEDLVRSVRAAVWGPPDADLDDLPLGIAFAAFGLGFIAGEEEAAVRTAGVWTRITLARGHVVVRGPAKTGLGEIRSTGASV